MMHKIPAAALPIVANPLPQITGIREPKIGAKTSIAASIGVSRRGLIGEQLHSELSA